MGILRRAQGESPALFLRREMAKEWAKKFYNSKRWIRCKDSYIDYRVGIDGGMCEECHNNLGYIVHHKTTLTPDNINNPDVSLNHRELKYVCKDCHDEYEGHGFGHKKKKPLCLFDANGQPISIREIDRAPLKNFELPGAKDRSQPMSEYTGRA